MTIALFLRALDCGGDYGLASLREFAKCLGYQLNRKFMPRQGYAALMAALVEEAPCLGDRLAAIRA